MAVHLDPDPPSNLLKLLRDGVDGGLVDIDALARALSSRSWWAGVPAAARQGVLHQLSGAFECFLDVDLGAAAVAGWKVYGDLLEAAKSTVEHPDRTEVVDLTGHDVRCHWTPAAELYLDQVRVARIEPDLSVALVFVGVVAVVEAGRLVRFIGGRCRAQARLELAGEKVLERNLSVVPGLLEIPVRRGGIRLAAA